MRKRAALLAVLVAVLLLSGCNSVVDPGPGTAAPIPEPDPIRFTGTGDHATGVFQLTGGLAVFEFLHQGTSNFIVWLYNSATGDRTALLVNEIGDYLGETAEGLESGSYLLNIRADGSWAVRITQPRPTSGAALPVNWTGQGDLVVGPVDLPRGLVRFQLQYDGESNFIVEVYHFTSTGWREALVVNTIGTYSGSQVVEIRTAGLYYVCVHAAKRRGGVQPNWEISVTR